MLPGWVTVLVAGFGLVLTLIVTLVAQARSDRRSRREERWRQDTARRERLRVQFERSLSSAFRFSDLVAPMSPMWKTKLTEEEVARIEPFLDQALTDAAVADVALRLEGEASALAAIRSIRDHFLKFRLAVRFQDMPAKLKALEQGRDDALDAATAIASELPDLEAALLKQLEALVPPGPPEKGRRKAIANWLGFGE
jgi:hypothetical protein